MAGALSQDCLHKQQRRCEGLRRSYRLSEMSASLKERLLERPSVYRWLQRAVASDRQRRAFVDDHLQVNARHRLLDVGCGTGSLLAYLPDVDYVGFDPNPSYIDAAVRRFGSRGRFLVAGIDNFDDSGFFDVVVAKGVLHHLDDDQVRMVAQTAQRLVIPGGRLVTIDPTLVDNQHPMSRFLVSRDRGEFVRTPEAYRALIATHMPNASVTTRVDLLRVPYTHAVTTASK